MRRGSLALATMLYMLGFAAGMISPMLPPTLEERFEAVWSLDKPGLTLYILANNMYVSLLAFLGGFTLVLPPLITLVNGAILGSIISLACRAGCNPILLAALIAPHGIFELPAFIVSCSLGLTLSLDLLAGKATLERLNQYARLYMKALVLLTIAAIVEAWVTPLLADLIIG